MSSVSLINGHIDPDYKKIMTDRDRLIKLLMATDECDGENCTLTGKDCQACLTERIADYLIANGVTVQELDSERIIRCKDCVYYRPAEDWNGNKYDACYLNAVVCIHQRKPTDFCSYAEQKLPEPPKGE